MANLKGGIYLRENWVNTYVNDILLPFPVEIDSVNIKKRTIVSGVQSGTGNIIEFSGTDPITFNLNIQLLAPTESQFKLLLDSLMQLFNTNVEMRINNPTLKRLNVVKFVVLNMSSYDEMVYNSTATLECSQVSVNRALAISSDTFFTTRNDLVGNWEALHGYADINFSNILGGL